MEEIPGLEHHEIQKVICEAEHSFDDYPGENLVKEESMAIVEKDIANAELSEISGEVVIMNFKHVPANLGKAPGKALACR